ncbi:malonic semialdehyde reductase [Actinotalea sp. AC32]|nr:malonic semialdehyde reductase [Actinotalea sp. AC32]
MTTATLTTPDGTLARLDADAQDALFRRPRTARAWSDAPVPDELVEHVHDLVRWNPTAFNSSPMRLLVVRSQDARSRLAAHMSPANRERVLGAPLTLVVAADTDFHEHLPRLAPHMPDARERFDGDPASRERLARDNAWLQAGYLLVALRAQGLEVGPMSGLDAPGVDADLLAGTAWRTLMVVNVGWPAAEPAHHPRADRLALADVARTV